MTEEFVTLPRKRYEELVAIETAYAEEHAGETQTPLERSFARFRAEQAQEDRERRSA